MKKKTKKKLVINLCDARVVYGVILFTWILVLGDAIIIHGLARDRIDKPSMHEIAYNKHIVRIEERVDTIEDSMDSIQSQHNVVVKTFEMLYMQIKNHKDSLHYGRIKNVPNKRSNQ